MTNTARTHNKSTQSTSTPPTDNNEKRVRASSSLQTKTFIRHRVDEFFSDPNNIDEYPNELKRWNEIKTNFGRTSLLVMAEFGLDKLHLKSYRKTAQWKSGDNQDKVEFLEPWPPRENPQPSPPAPKHPPPSPAARESLTQVCRELYGSEPKYDTVELCDTSGDPVYETTVTHPNNSTIKGTAMALTQDDSRNEAVKAALKGIQAGIDMNDTENEPVTPDVVPMTQDNDADDGKTINVIDATPPSTPHMDPASIIDIMEKNFKRLFISTLNDMTEDFDRRISNLIDTAVENTIQTSVTKTVDKYVTDIIENKLKDAANTKLDKTFKTEFINNMKPAIENDISKACIESVTKEVRGNALKLISEQKTIFEQSITSSTNSFKQLAECHKKELSANRKQIKTDIKQIYDTHLVSLQIETNNHLNNIDNNAFDAIANIEETTQAQTKLVLDTINDEVAYVLNNNNILNMSSQQPNNATFEINEEAIHRDSFNETETIVHIMDAHSDESLIPYYTIRYQNGKERITTSDCLRKKNTPISKIQNCGRFSKVDASLLGSHKPSQVHSTNNFVTPTRQSPQSLPESSPSEIKFFHSHFKSPLKNKGDIISFYKQLRAQGRLYNLHLIDLNDIKEDVDLCPSGIPTPSREKMALAIY